MTDSSVTNRNQNSQDARDESARDNDPLFELSRIFGFEEPADQPNAYRPQPEVENFSEVSLERELIADFDVDFGVEFAAAPVADDRVFMSQQSQVAAPEPQWLSDAESSHYNHEQAVEPRFTGYAPLQRAYAEHNTPPAQQPEFYDQAVIEPELSSGAYYGAATDLSFDDAFLEPEQATNLDYLSSLETELSGDFVSEALQPQHYSIAEDVAYAQDYGRTGFENVAQPPADLSLEDELSFLLQDQATATDIRAEPVVADTNFAPLFDAPVTEFAPVAQPYAEVAELSEVTSTKDYADIHPAQNYADIDDEFFDAPDLTHLPNRTSSSYVAHDDYALEADTRGQTGFTDNSFADLFGAKSQADFKAEPQVESFIFGDDFSSVEESNRGVTPSFAQGSTLPEGPVGGLSSYTFGAATASASDHSANSYSDVQEAHRYDDEVDFDLSGNLDEEPIAGSDDFISSDDFDFSFEDELHAAVELPVAEEEVTSSTMFEEPEIPVYQPSYSVTPKNFSSAPEIEAISVAETRVEQTQTLDLPDVSFGDDAKETGLNSLESEFAEIFSTISVSDGSGSDSTNDADNAFETILQDNFADYHASFKTAQYDNDGLDDVTNAVVAGLATASAASAAARGSASQAGVRSTNQDDYYNHWAAQGTQANDFDQFNLGDSYDRNEPELDEYRARPENPLRKPVLWASVAAVALIVLGGGYYLLKSGGVVGGEPELLLADNNPVKIQPENPGGAVVPNQDKAVYDRVAGDQSSAPEQKILINTEEEPVDVGLLQGQDAEEDGSLLGEQDSNDAAMANQQGTENSLIVPRTVKTMIVRADGTLVPGEAPAAEPEPTITDSGLDEASRLISESAVPERLGSDDQVASAQTAAAPRVVQTQTFTASGDQVAPREVVAAPVVPSRPAAAPAQAQVPTQVQTQVQTQAPTQAQAKALQQVASANVAAGTWFIQVASQPSEELAQKNYSNLTSRYGNIIGGRGVDIKKADIAGKGTYYRVRIPGGTKAEAAALCERLKSAGGSCFPTL